ncbi:hypothetical protein DK45_4122 [Bordetella bronchiseptica]|nr:hypothetical protein DK45_4122 [Bordetella bronchiseptica]
MTSDAHGTFMTTKIWLRLLRPRRAAPAIGHDWFTLRIISVARRRYHGQTIHAAHMR